MRRVAIVGMGAVTPLGLDVETSWAAAKAGKVGIDKITLFETENLKVHIAGEVKDFDPQRVIDGREARRMDRFTQFAIDASDQAVNDSGLDFDKVDRERVAVYVGSGIGGFRTLETEFDKLERFGPQKVSPLFVPMMVGNMGPGQIAMRYGILGPCLDIVTACATGNNNIGEAALAIARRDVDIALAGGSEAAITPLGVAGFTNMTALTQQRDITRASIPFDARRDGFVIGEGAAILVLEAEELAKARGAKIYGYIAGYGNTCDAYHITAPDPEGSGAIRAMKLAMQRAEITPDKIDYINAHGTSTPAGDKMETIAIKGAFGEHAQTVSISSTKSMTGHLLGAAGAVEAMLCVKAINENFVPPTAGYREQDPDCDLDYTPNVGREKQVRYAMSNAFGFGGHNAVVIISSPEL